MLTMYSNTQHSCHFIYRASVRKYMFYIKIKGEITYVYTPGTGNETIICIIGNVERTNRGFDKPSYADDFLFLLNISRKFQI